MDVNIVSDVVVGGVLASLVLALWRDVRLLGDRVDGLSERVTRLGERVARLEGWLERDRTAVKE